MRVEVIKTHRLQCGESLSKIFDHYITTLTEKSIVAVTSKVVSICEGRVVLKTQCSKDELIEQEADATLETDCDPYGIYLTIKNKMLIPSAGIDESNVEGLYVLHPEDAQKTAEALWTGLRQKHGLKDLGIIITDSHTTPMRRGVTGISLGWCGFEPLYSYIGEPDIYGRLLQVTQVNLLDALATSAVLMMGEGSEQTPLAIIQNAPKVSFLDRPPTPEEEADLYILMEDDLYAPFLMNGPWRKNKKHYLFPKIVGR